MINHVCEKSLNFENDVEQTDFKNLTQKQIMEQSFDSDNVYIPDSR